MRRPPWSSESPAAFGDDWGADRQAGATVIGSPDQADRVAAAKQAELATRLDAREQSLVGRSATVEPQIIVTQRPYVGDGGDRFTIVPTSSPDHGGRDRLRA